MAQAFRSRRSGQDKSGENDLLISGTYNVEEKITVEWERLVTIDDLVTLARSLPERHYSRREIRSFISGHLQMSDSNLPGTKISNYRISSRSLIELLDYFEERDVLARSDDRDREDLWTPRKQP